MKIKSSFKDYYDYVAHAYGGGDPKILYIREQVPVTRHVIESNTNWIMHQPYYIPNSEFSWLVVNGACYTLMSIVDPETGKKSPPKFFTQENFGEYVESIKNSRYYFRKLDIKNDRYQGVKSAIVTNLSRHLRQPVFIIKSYSACKDPNKHIFEVDSRIPILQHYQFHKYFSPEQLYQEIAYYISNTMHESPDLVVHDNMTNKEKILQHGFDLQTSFRHPTK